MSTARGVHILATSREPLQVEGEHVFRLEPLEVPPVSEGLDAAEALRFPAVQLFVERMAASHDDFELHDEDAPLVAEICRKLDGIPLAIELAAARVDLGLRELVGPTGGRVAGPQGWPPRGAAPPPDDARHVGLELWPAQSGRTDRPQPTGYLCRWIHARRRRRGGRRCRSWRRRGRRYRDGSGDEIAGCDRRKSRGTALSTVDGDTRLRPREGQRARRTPRSHEVPCLVFPRALRVRLARRCRVRPGVRRPCGRDRQSARRARMGLRATGRSGGRHRPGSRFRAALDLKVDAGRVARLGGKGHRQP